MIPLKLNIKNFLCHSESFIDFTKFNSAIIVGKIENNELYSNGVGKSSIFKAIEYCLFNYSSSNLDSIIRDDTETCEVSFDFSISNIEYRIIRKRSKKNDTSASDLSLLKKDSEIWKDISGRRASDTEKEIEKLIKINQKSFRNTIHFVQSDFTSLASVTASNRKSVLKDVLNISIYQKLEKITKEQMSILSKDIDKNRTFIDSFGNPEKDLINLNDELNVIISNLEIKNNELSKIKENVSLFNNEIFNLKSKKIELENNSISFLNQKNNLLKNKLELEVLVQDYLIKKNSILENSKNIKKSIDKYNSQKNIIDDQILINLLSKQEELKNNIIINNTNIQNNLLKYEELNIPFIETNDCKYCRQSLSEEHKKKCKQQIQKDKDKISTEINSIKKILVSLTSELKSVENLINEQYKLQIFQNNLINDINLATLKLAENHKLYEEYKSSLENYNKSLSSKIIEIEEVEKQLDLSSIKEIEIIDSNIKLKTSLLESLNKEIFILNKEIVHFESSKSVTQYNIEQKNINKNKILNLKSTLKDQESKYKVYLLVAQSFSSTGIPNLIIQNVLSDLQIEANNLLQKLKPGLQLFFITEKSNADGIESDTLDIQYFYNGKERVFDQLSGGMQFVVSFSLKLGLSFLLQKVLGTDIKFLLLDEVDQSLDKASIDIFTSIIKSLQEDMTVLVISHNDRSKEQFNSIIEVQQNINNISTVKVIQ